MFEVSEWWYSPDIVTLSVVWIIPRWMSRKRLGEGEEWLMWSWTEKGDRRRCRVEPMPKRRGAADSADHIKVSYVTYVDLAGVCVRAWASICVCVLFPGVGGQWARHEGYMEGHGCRLMEVVWKCAYAQAMYLWYAKWGEVGRGKIRLQFQFGEGEAEKEEWSSGKTLRLIFSTGGF